MITDSLQGERGSMIVTVAIGLVAFAMLGGAVLEVGQWFMHRRHIQVRADSAALSAGQALEACFNIPSVFPNETAADTYIENWGRNYGGFSSIVSTDTGAPYNKQFKPSTSNLMSFQSNAYPSAGNPTPTRDLTPAPGGECFKDGDWTNTAQSNVNLMTDVKMTQAGVPPWFIFSPLVTVHGWARTELQSITSAQPAMPLAVPDVNPKHVSVTFVDNSTGHALTGCANPGCVFPLTGPTLSGTINNWGGQATFPIPSADTNVGVRVAIGSTNGSCAGVNFTATYTCYDYTNSGGSSPRGIVAIRSYSTGAVSGGTPMLRGVDPTSCSGTPFFSQYQATSGTCNGVGFTAHVDFPAGATNPLVTGKITQGNCNNNGLTNLTHGAGNSWDFPAESLPTAGGAWDVCLGWSYGTNQKGSFGIGSNGSPVQQIFSGSDGTDPTDPGGPIQAAMITDTGGLPFYSAQTGTSATVAVTIGLTGGVHINPRCSGSSGKNYTCASDPTVLLRTKTKTGSLTYAVDCGTVPGHTGGTLAQQIQYGCANSYSINAPDQCPDPTVPAPDPPSCVPVQTGIATGQVRSAMNARFAPGGVCDANNYPDTKNPDDPRLVLLIDTDFSAFIGSGGSSSSDVPVVTFATFYITGWGGAPAGCNSQNEPQPANAAAEDIWGHFVKALTGNSNPSGFKCNVTALAPCVPALVR